MSPGPRLQAALLVLLLGSALAGCITSDDGTTLDPVPGDVIDLLPADATADLAALQVPAWDTIPDVSVETREWLKAYAQGYANRISFTPINDMANQYLFGELEALGYEVRMIEYGPEVTGDASPVTYKVIEAIRLGTVEPDKHIGFIAHHDARYNSNEAAYDDGSGTAATLAIARHFAEVDTRKSISILMMDGEEMGLRASCYYANDVVRGDAPYYDIAFGYDMVGINWPGHDWNMFLMMGGGEHVTDLLLPLAESVFQDKLGLPAGTEEQALGITLLPTHDRNSDERRFREVGIPIYRWAGGRAAGDYPHYHEPTDTYDNMIAFAGSEGAFEQGMHSVVASSIAMTHAADQYAFPAWELGERDCAFQGDDDGPL